MKILVFGHSGQVATELRALDGDDVQITALARADADLTDPAACAAAINAHGPDAVINAAAYTAVDKAESDAETAQIINADAPAAMARAFGVEIDEIGIEKAPVSVSSALDQQICCRAGERVSAAFPLRGSTRHLVRRIGGTCRHSDIVPARAARPEGNGPRERMQS